MNHQRKYDYAPPLPTKPGRLTAWKVGAHGKGGFNAGPSPSGLADEIADATFGARAEKLAEAEWHTAHRRDHVSQP